MPNYETLEDEDEDGEREEEQEEDEEEELPPPVQTATAMPQVLGPKKRKRNPASSHKGKEVAKRGRVPETATRPSQADLLWVDILARDEIVSRGVTADHFSIRVARLEAGQEVHLGVIDGSRCGGDGSNEDSMAEALMRILTDEFHWHTSRGMPCTYQLTFCFKRNGSIYDKGKVRLASTQELAQMRNAQMQPQQSAQGLGAPPQYAPQYAPQGYGYQPPPQYPQHGAPQSHGAPSSGDEDLRAQVATLTDLVRDLLRGGGRGLGQAPQHHQQQQQQVPLAVLNEITRVLAPLGLQIGPVASRQLPPAPQHVAPPMSAGGLQLGLGDLTTFVNGIKQLRFAAREIEEAFAPDERTIGVGQAPQEEPEPKAEPDFELVEVPGSQWSNGSPMRYARDENGLSLWGTAFANPWAMEKFGTTLAGLGKKIVRKMGQQQGIGALPELDDDEDFEDEEEEEEPEPQPAGHGAPQTNGAARAVKDDGFSL